MASRGGEYFTHWRGDGTAWPAAWPEYAQRWPTRPPPAWRPERAGPAVIMCMRDHSSQIVAWRDADEAAEAERELYGQPCGRGCESTHLRVWCTPGRLHIAPSVHDTPISEDLAGALRQCYPRRAAGHRLETIPARWPTPAEFNPPLTRKGARPMTPEDLQRRQELAVEANATPELRPTPGGAAARAAAEHHAAAGLRERPDAANYADQIAGHEMASRPWLRALAIVGVDCT